jgi:hypothetical protein
MQTVTPYIVLTLEASNQTLGMYAMHTGQLQLCCAACHTTALQTTLW